MDYCKVTIRVNKEDYFAFRVKCLEEGKSVGATLGNWINAYLKKDAKGPIKSFTPTQEEKHIAELSASALEAVKGLNTFYTDHSHLKPAIKALKPTHINKLTGKARACLHGRQIGIDYCSQCGGYAR